MKELTLFYFDGCPHCANAMRWQEELFAEHPEFKDVPLTLIDEHKQPELADQYDYWLVPTYYLGSEKLYEGVKDKSLVAAAFQRALEA